MPDFLCISIHFLGDDFHGRDEQGEPEWPPSPLRLFQALVATNARLDNQADAALLWLEQQTPPVIISPQPAAVQPQGYKSYVPNNEGDLAAKKWAKGNYFDSKNHPIDISGYRSEKIVTSTMLECNGSFPGVHFLWSLEKGLSIPTYTELLNAVRAVSQFGWGIDLVVADIAIIAKNESDNFVGEKWLPSESLGGQSLRVPASGTFDDLKNRHAAFLNRISLDSNVFKPVPPISRYAVATYRRASEMSRPPYAVFAIRKIDDSGFAAFSATRRGLHLSGMLRFAASRDDFAAALGWDNERVARFVLGHGERPGSSHQPVNDQRLVFVPLPSIEWQGHKKGDTVGAIRRVLVTAKGRISNDEFKRIVRNLEGCELIEEETGEIVAFLRKQSDKDRAIKDYFAKACEWVSVTPVILPGYDDPGNLRRRLNAGDLSTEEKANLLTKLETRIEHLIRKALRQADYPEGLVKHAQIQWRGSGYLPGVDLAKNYAVPDQHRRFRRLHVRILWRDAQGNPIEIQGPVCIGGGRFTGLGLFAPVKI
ncbi:MAG: type I-U CRISPR-associated protein Csb2 [Desulfuromonas thiophila]|jgi:CRISPR-associated protein Csb2|nr:type I-U CRISPR-associated protein Csb2 [Desulfuromonas thiophila]